MYFLNSVKKLIVITGATMNLESLFKKKCRASFREKKLVYDCSHLPIAGYGHARA